MITRVSTTTEGYDPPRKGRRVVTIDDLHQELIGGHVEYAEVCQPDGSYNNVEIVGGELGDIWAAFKHLFCRITGLCENAGTAVSQAVETAKDKVVQMLPEGDGESPGNSAPPGFEEIPTADSMGPGLPASSAPEDYKLPPVPPPIPASAIPVMQSVVSRVKQGDPTAVKSIQSLAQSAIFNPVAAQTLKNIAAVAANTPITTKPVTPITTSISSSLPQTTTMLRGLTSVIPQPVAAVSTPVVRAPLTPIIRGDVLVNGGAVADSIQKIFHLVLSPLAWTLDGTGRLTAVAGQKLVLLSRML